MSTTPELVEIRAAIGAAMPLYFYRTFAGQFSPPPRVEEDADESMKEATAMPSSLRRDATRALIWPLPSRTGISRRQFLSADARLGAPLAKHDAKS